MLCKYRMSVDACISTYLKNPRFVLGKITSNNILLDGIRVKLGPEPAKVLSRSSDYAAAQQTGKTHHIAK